MGNISQQKYFDKYREFTFYSVGYHIYANSYTYDMGKNRGGIFKSKLSGSVDNINDDFCNKINKVFSNRSYLYDNTVVCSRIENQAGTSGFSNFELCIEYEKILDHEIYDGPDGVSITMYDDVEAYLKKCHKETFANSIRFVTGDT